MRTLFIETNEVEVGEDLDDAALNALVEHRAPWAAHVEKVEGGYLAFESTVDYQTWMRQQ